MTVPKQGFLWSVEIVTKAINTHPTCVCIRSVSIQEAPRFHVPATTVVPKAVKCSPAMERNISKIHTMRAPTGDGIGMETNIMKACVTVLVETGGVAT